MVRRYLSVEEQETIKSRARQRCEYCLCPAAYSAQSFVYEHIVPIAKGGETDLDNLCYACGGCNGHKFTKTEAIDPLSKLTVPLYHPRRQLWHDHFDWADDYLSVIGLSPIGRATIIALNMNRQGVMNIRALLLMVGKHPPSMD